MATSMRYCLNCNQKSVMSTWLGNYNSAQLIALLGLLMYVIPGLIFIIWAWGKFKCEKCGAVGKNTASLPINERNDDSVFSSTKREEKDCPWCAEKILTAAKICKHCGRDA